MKKIYHAKDDIQFQNPFIDLDEIRNRKLLDGTQQQYRFIHGGFKGTNVKFSFSFPMKEHYEGRFFQHLSPFPGPDEEIASQDKEGMEDRVAFAITHGGCFVESNMGSGAVFSSHNDSSIYYRSSAAVAEYCREVAQRLFGPHRVYGYVFGGSGGGYKTMSCIENTDAWDGALPYVIGSPMSLPNCLTIGAHGNRVLRDCWRRIQDALEPGGSGDPYAGLTDDEADCLREMINIGIPPRTIVCGDSDGSLPVLLPTVYDIDPSYFEDFWTKPGYLGSVPNSSAQRDRIVLHTAIEGIGVEAGEEESGIDSRNGVDDAWQKMLSDGSNAYLLLSEIPEQEDPFLRGAKLIVESGEATGVVLTIGSLNGHRLSLGMCFGTPDVVAVLRKMKPGDRVCLDNSDYIAAQTYHRHQVPEDRSFVGWEQYRDDRGDPIYPQRNMILSYLMASSSGSLQDGQIQGKVIIMNNLMDGDFPWQADWYRRKIESVNDDAEGKVRLWYNDNCPHGDYNYTDDELHTTIYLGMLYQGLVHLSRWVEKGIVPPDNTGYTLDGAQIVPYENAQSRKGIQPVVKVLAGETDCTKAKPGENITFTAIVETPPMGGDCVRVCWSFEGEQDFPVETQIVKEENGAFISTATHCFEKIGTYFAVARAEAARNPSDPYTYTRNIARCRVKVVDN